MAKEDHEDEFELCSTDEGHETREGLLGEASEELTPTESKEPILKNLTSNFYAWLAQACIWLLVSNFWVQCFIHGLIFFSAHILLNTAGVLLLTQSILLLQPTSTPVQKRRGTAYHFIFNVGSLSALLAGLVIIEINKISHKGAHFQSAHAILGLFTYLLLLVQGIVGFTQYYTPMVYGSVDRAKSIWKYHRMSGYLTLAMCLATIIAATRTGYNLDVLKVPVWLILSNSMTLAYALGSRVHLKKFGFGQK